MDAPEDTIIRVGTAGWSYADWKGIVYPPDMPRSQHPLSLLSSLFDAMEINASFYRPVNPRHAEGWLRHIAENPQFRFSAKAWSRFTHERDAWPGEVAVHESVEGLKPLRDAGKLSGLLAQFPWSFRRTPENRTWLARLCDAFSDWPLVIEVRHASWDCPAFYEGLRARRIAFCNIDQPLLRDCLPPTMEVTAPLAYVRLHGRNEEHWFRQESGRNDRYNYLYREDELRPWIEKVRAMKGRPNEIFMVTNNHYRGQAVVNALEIQAALGNFKRTLPQSLVQRFPRLLNLPQDHV
jgi:uncharacterized protein YecE (DUF72 family)